MSKVLTSPLTPAIGASLAGYALVVAPNNDFRVVIAIYVASRAAEFGYNALEADGWFEKRPWWFGSWMLMPPVMGQLLHAFVFDRDCFPKVCDFKAGITCAHHSLGVRTLHHEIQLKLFTRQARTFA